MGCLQIDNSCPKILNIKKKKRQILRWSGALNYIVFDSWLFFLSPYFLGKKSNHTASVWMEWRHDCQRLAVTYESSYKTIDVCSWWLQGEEMVCEQTFVLIGTLELMETVNTEFVAIWEVSFNFFFSGQFDLEELLWKGCFTSSSPFWL